MYLLKANNRNCLNNSKRQRAMDILLELYELKNSDNIQGLLSRRATVILDID